jgi:hypothetical protein
MQAARHELGAGQFAKASRFLLIQGVGKYDFVKAD